MSERQLEALALALVGAAMLGLPAPWWAILVVAVVTAVSWSRAPGTGLAGAALVLVMAVGTLARAAEPPPTMPARAVEGWVVARTDAQHDRHRWSFVLDAFGRRFIASLPDSDAENGREGTSPIEEVTAGREVLVRGRCGRLDARWSWRAARHLAGRCNLTAIVATRPGALPWRTADAFRAALDHATVGWDSDDRALFNGVVVGDDREQSALLRHRFRVSGLAHLLAVSGQNVAFVLLVAAPLLRRPSVRWRWMVAAPLLGWFALLTRLEPSVLRAVAMASVALVAAARGRWATGRRTLAAAVVVMVLVDPMMVWSLGWQLSVAASWSVLVLSRPISRGLRGPRWCREVVAVSLAAQLGTAPLLLSVGVAVPLAGLVANVVAVPVAGWLMVWGMTAAPLAGLVGLDGTSWVMWPARLATRWLAGVAAWGADPRWPLLGPARLGLLAACASPALLAVYFRSRGAPRTPGGRRSAGVAALGAVGLVGAVVLWPLADPAPMRVDAADGSALCIAADGARVLVLGAVPDTDAVLRATSGAAVTSVDAVAVARDNSAVATTLHEIRSALEVRWVIGPPGLDLAGVKAVDPGQVEVGEVRLLLGDDPPRWTTPAPDGSVGPAR